jgi:capsular exopolysaccharide synthesis family protein
MNQLNKISSTSQGKILMVTSSEPNEGKSTITSNLAIAFSQAGKKVIVVDCDLHIPQQHKIHGLSNDVGLSTILSKPMKYEGAVKKTRYPGMSVLTSGPIPTEPSKLLNSQLMTTIMKTISDHYDVVLLDTPAFLAVSDTTHLASLVDAVILVVRRNLTREETVREACKQLVEIDTPIIGVVVNNAERNGTYYYYDRKV